MRAGIDAPYVIISLFSVGGVVFLGAWAAYRMLYDTHSCLALYVMISACATGVVLWIEALLMLYSSLRGKKQVVESIVNRLPLTGSERVLDVGCGRGVFLIALANRLTTGHAYGLDLWSTVDQAGNCYTATQTCIQEAGLSDKVTLATGDMTSMPFEDTYFDLVVSSLAVHNVSGKEHRKKALQEIVRVLKPGGYVVLVDFQYTKEYATYLREEGCEDVTLSSRYYRMFPPVRVVTGKKPR